MDSTILFCYFPDHQMCYALTRVSSRSTKDTENRVPELMNGYVVERFIAARLRGADDENKQRGMIHVKAMTILPLYISHFQVRKCEKQGII